LDAQPSVASIRLPEGAAPKVSAPVQVRRAHIRAPTQHRAPNQEPGRILIPGDGAAGDQGVQNRPACAAIAATRRLRPVPSQRFLALWCQAHTPSCSRQVTSTSIRMVKPGPASAPRGHAPLRTDTLSLARTISDRRVFTSLRGRPSSPYQAQISPYRAASPLSADIRYRRSCCRRLPRFLPDAKMARGRRATGSLGGWPDEAAYVTRDVTRRANAIARRAQETTHCGLAAPACAGISGSSRARTWPVRTGES
jgi:hypothetical protein